VISGFLAGLAHLISGASVRWIGCEPSGRQRVYFSNHTSHLDTAVIWSAFPPEVRRLVRPVAAKEYWDRGGLRRFLAVGVFNSILIGRGSPMLSRGQEGEVRTVIDVIAEEMGSTHSLVIFPEGTRGEEGKVGEFKSGIYHLCLKKPGIELVPVYLENLNRILPKGEFMPVPLAGSVTFGPPIRMEQGEACDVFLKRAHDAVAALAKD